MKITLIGIERAFARGKKRTSIIEKYEKVIELNKEEKVVVNRDNAIPFEFQLSDTANESLIGEYSEYFWGLEAKVNFAWSSDINTKTLIEII
jgi:hypothetical protein